MFKLLETDFYQVSMVFAYGVLNEANKTVGFEAFVRNIKPEVAGNLNHYRFSGTNDVILFMEKIRIEVQNPLLPYVIVGLVKDKLKANPRRDELIKTFLDNFEFFSTDFEYNVYPEYGKLYPYVPAFQFRGPLWIGQLIETQICNIINGKTGFITAEPFMSEEELCNTFSAVVGGNIEDFDNTFLVSDPYDVFLNYKADIWKEYAKNLNALKIRAKEYRDSTSKVLLEAAFRRAPSLEFAKDATRIALAAGWQGTSNLAAFFDDFCDLDKVAGTMAHSFVMSHRHEIEAYVKWNRIFPNSTILVDTYDTISTVEFLIDAGIKPAVVRIDSDPLVHYTLTVRKMLDSNKWNDVKIFISGDLTPKMLRDFEINDLPFDMCMAGTKYANINGLEKINPGFVYKIVEVNDEAGVFFPEKKAKGKKNYPGLKRLTVHEDLLIAKNGGSDFGMHFSDMALEKTENVHFAYQGAIQ